MLDCITFRTCRPFSRCRGLIHYAEFSQMTVVVQQVLYKVLHTCWQGASLGVQLPMLVQDLFLYLHQPKIAQYKVREQPNINSSRGWFLMAVLYSPRSHHTTFLTTTWQGPNLLILQFQFSTPGYFLYFCICHILQDELSTCDIIFFMF